MEIFQEFLERMKEKKLIVFGGVGVFLVCLVGIIGWTLGKGQSDQAPQALALLSESSSIGILSSEVISMEEASQSSQQQDIFVDIKGEVKKPGVYQLSEGDRLQDLIDKAQGFTADAKVDQINLAQKLTDQMMVIVPNKNQVTESQDTSDQELITEPAAQENDKNSGKININTANVGDLTQLSGIGQKKAEKIIEYRQDKGSFKQIEDLKNVSGIGDKTFESLKDQITVGD